MKSSLNSCCLGILFFYSTQIHGRIDSGEIGMSIDEPLQNSSKVVKKVQSEKNIPIQDETLFRKRSLCQGNVSFCTNPSMYPREAAKLALENLKGQHAILRMMDSQLIFPGQSVSIADGFERPEGRLTQFHNEFKWESHLETRICPSDVHFITPKRAMNNRKEYKFILNGGDIDETGFQQTVRVEVCHSANAQGDFGKETEYVNDLVPTVCHQEYATVSLLVLTDNPEVSNLQVDNFQFPTACVCYRQI